MATKKKTPEAVKARSDWRATFVARFPQFASIIDGGTGEAEARQVFGNELVDLILDVAQNPGNYDLTTQAGQAAFDAKVIATPYYQTTTNTRKNFDVLPPGDKEETIRNKRMMIAANYGDLGLTVTELDKIAADASRSGLDGLALSQYINSMVGGRARGRDDLLDSLDAQALKKVARSYGYNPSDLDDQILSAVTGKTYEPTGTVITADTIRQKGQMLAKSAYFQLADKIDAGLSLDEIFQPYKSLAARVLERSEADIDFNNPVYSSAFGNKEQGQPTLSDWERMLRTDPKYGYQYTTQANQDATNLGLSIAKAFGKVR